MRVPSLIHAVSTWARWQWRVWRHPAPEPCPTLVVTIDHIELEGLEVFHENHQPRDGRGEGRGEGALEGAAAAAASTSPSASAMRNAESPLCQASLEAATCLNVWPALRVDASIVELFVQNVETLVRRRTVALRAQAS